MRNESLYFNADEQCTEEYHRSSASEELTFDVTEEILIIMEDKGITKKDLADKLGKSKAYISQLLSGSKNMTLRTLSDLCFALGVKPSVGFDESQEFVLSDNTTATFEPTKWQHLFAEEDRAETCAQETKVVAKSNIVYKTEIEFWHKVAA
ncbi:hypothetical protein 7AX3_78 [uncultured Caudovirales phage]|uniref:HTH cro/C1-type domain-containing protein n=1 Tax=uncultured Caudovirales phage TaxID=2100421 RepID=A0A2H4J1D2_9CAUD|nr:hypothetical protein 7AX3_78 [uncultured Caudovirales phage]